MQSLLRAYFSPEEVTALAKLQDKYGAECIPSDDLEDEETREGRKVRHFLSQKEDQEEPLFIIDMSAIVRQMLKWRVHLPNVRPYYAVKCNNYAPLIEMLHNMGAGFDCASKAEIEQVLEQGANPNDIIYANPCKQVSHMQAARASGVRVTTVDNESELPKLRKHWPDAKILIRIATDDSAALCQFSSKFGASLETARDIVRAMKTLGLDLCGVSFHVGSGGGSAMAYAHAARTAHEVFEMGRAAGFNMNMLDIGGGFPGTDDGLLFEDIAQALAPVLTELFPDTQIIAEPGRFFAAASHTLAANVFSKRVVSLTDWCPPNHSSTTQTNATTPPSSPLVHGKGKEKEYQYYVNDGAYQSFNCLFFDHAIVKPYPLPWGRPEMLSGGAFDSGSESDGYSSSGLGKDGNILKTTTIYGPTCDSLDCIVRRVPFPEMYVGDWVFFANMGAYTRAAASPFNGFFQWRIAFSTDTDFSTVMNE